jgi:glucose-6-phosphate 1-dehydrogenase
MQFGMIGLGRMGGNMVRRLMRDGHACVVQDVSPDAVAGLASGTAESGYLHCGSSGAGHFVEEPAAARLGDYERLLGDAVSGDATLFARQDVVEAAWAIVDALLADPGRMFEYEPGSWGPPQADGLVAEVGGWNTPQ